MFFQGRPLGEGECLIGGPGETAESVSRRAHSQASVSIALDAWQSESHWLPPSPLAAMTGVALLSPGAEWNDNFLGSVEWLITAVISYPDVMQRFELRRGLEEWLLARMNGVRAQATDPCTNRATRARRRIAVERARAYIHDNQNEPITLSDLCRHVHMQPRSLEYGFREMLGLTPMAYVKTLRLHRVRRLLQSGVASARSVSDIALDCGFWHLSQFAVDYKKYFGECPSATSRRTLALRGRTQRTPATPADHAERRLA
ncbi:MAG TPA: helix-turn-helix domain-containing protein [Steroidobacter sp.]|nr:helix-turn-helix domain-containing protein [Steroidobacter sp.]